MLKFSRYFVLTLILEKNNVFNFVRLVIDNLMTSIENFHNLISYSSKILNLWGIEFVVKNNNFCV